MYILYWLDWELKTCLFSHPPTGNMPSPNAPLKRVLAYTGCFSRMSTIKDIHEYLSQRLRIKEEDMRLWLYNSEVRFFVAFLCSSTVLLLYLINMHLHIIFNDFTQCESMAKCVTCTLHADSMFYGIAIKSYNLLNPFLRITSLYLMMKITL